MQIERHFVPTSTLEEFADANGLVMEVHERGASLVAMAHIGPGARYYAHFKGASVLRNSCSIGVFGDGATPEQAIAAYVPEISETELVVRVGEERRQITVPRLRPGEAS